jgi:DNA-binding winged helix-turn-helix (wHTH) protein
MELLDLLARAAPKPVERYELSERLEVSLEMLYRLVYRLRGQLGEGTVLQVGRSTTRRGKVHGRAGYRLTRPCVRQAG